MQLSMNVSAQTQCHCVGREMCDVCVGVYLEQRLRSRVTAPSHICTDVRGDQEALGEDDAVL